MTNRDPAPSGLWNLQSLVPGEAIGEELPAPPGGGPPPAAEGLPAPPVDVAPPQPAVPDPAPPPVGDTHTWAPPATLRPGPPAGTEPGTAAPRAPGTLTLRQLRDRNGPDGDFPADPPDTSSPGAADWQRWGGKRWIPVAVGGFLAVLLVIGLTATGLRGAADTVEPPRGPASLPAGPLAEATTTEGPTTAVSTGGSDVETTAATPTATATDDEAAALAELNRIRSEDLPTVSFAGQYVAQLASKIVGIVDPDQTAPAGSHTFYAADILAEHRKLRDGTAGTTVVLLLSTDFGKRQLYQGEPLWITFALGDFPNREAVTQWCAARFPELSGKELLNQCAVRKLEPRRG
jgi:hypothetical protein